MFLLVLLFVTIPFVVYQKIFYKDKSVSTLFISRVRCEWIYCISSVYFVFCNSEVTAVCINKYILEQENVAIEILNCVFFFARKRSLVHLFVLV
jgi:hypothetical protein